MRLGDGDYELQLNAGVAHVAGEAGAIDRLQRSSARYLQRPDADYLSLRSAPHVDDRHEGGGELERRNARHWLWQVGTETETPEFETNDLGRLTSGDDIGSTVEIEYRETRPGRWLRELFGEPVDARASGTMAGIFRRWRSSRASRLTWPNFWRPSLSGIDQSPARRTCA